jgi:hypothetical protein
VTREGKRCDSDVTRGQTAAKSDLTGSVVSDWHRLGGGGYLLPGWNCKLMLTCEASLGVL